MPKAFSKRKRAQIKRFFLNSKKSLQLAKRAMRRGTFRRDSSRGTIFDSNIAGKKRTVKVASGEHLARLNIMLLGRAHVKAIKAGAILAEHYSLRVVQYLFADKRVGIMKTVPGIGLETLQEIARGEYADLDPTLPWLKLGRQILEKNPGITSEKLGIAKAELYLNLRRMEGGKYDFFSSDLHGKDNILVTGQDKTGKLQFTLIDQLHPFDKWVPAGLLKLAKEKTK